MSFLSHLKNKALSLFTKAKPILDGITKGFGIAKNIAYGVAPIIEKYIPGASLVTRPALGLLDKADAVAQKVNGFVQDLDSSSASKDEAYQ